ncbi:MATH domain and coiled-coil domain-containing protein At3g58360-like [Lotus japonicus]|uniref:MATH domain and coiled-coil domain-containing protein At3g58360-like n=1 Tax=Lotus japonicus TaxID=34305 RepID=UPI00258B9E23|nr:MATH domain and coiled-coil domain-containing protein At3g58360-like [Lotus japonicus]
MVVGELKNQHIHMGDKMLQKLTWTINNFSKWDSDELCSENFYVGGHPWRIAIYPKGHNTGYLSIYLSGDLPNFDAWSRFANFKLALINQLNAKKTITAGSQYKFSESEPDYGWPEFIPLVEFRNFRSGFIVNDTCIVEAEITVVKPEHVTQADQVVSKPVVCSEPVVQVTNINPLGDLVDFKSFGKIEKVFVPLLEEVCKLHPSLIDCQQKRSRRFTEWAFTALGQILHFLKSRKVKDMNADACSHLQLLWEELQTFNFDLTWLQPHIQSALSMKNYIEKAVQLKAMKENLATLEMETKSLKEKIFTAEVDLEIARRDLAKGLEERDLDADLAYGGP